MSRLTPEARRASTGRHIRGPAPADAWHRRIVAGGILLVAGATVTPASVVPALFGAAVAAIGLSFVPPFVSLAVAFAAVAVALWTSTRYVALLRRTSIQSIGAVKRFSSGGHRSIYDPETGFCTSSYFLLRVEEELARSKRNAAPFSLLLLDPNLGTSELLHRQLYKTLEGAFRTADLISRLDDERIAVLLVDSGTDGTNTVADRLAAELGRNVAITLAVYPEDGTDLQSLMAALGADRSVVFPQSEAIWSPGASAFDREDAA